MNKNKIIKSVRPEEIIEARFNLSSKENDIIDMVLNIINDDGKYVYNFDVKEYAKIYTYGGTNAYRDLKKATNELFEKHNKFYVKDKETGQEIGFVWFSMLKYNDKEGTISFEIGQTLKEILLNMKSKIFYELKYSLNLKSIYSKRMYYYLKRFEDTGWRRDTVKDLIEKMECSESYKNNFKVFKQRILEVAKEEINIYSDIEFDYIMEKEGRKVTRLKFEIRKKILNDEIAVTKEEKEPSEIKEMAKEVQAIFYKHKIKISEARAILKDSGNNLELIKKCYEYMLSKNIENVVGYARRIVRNFNEPQNNKKPETFNNFQQRTYNFEELEKGLLGWDK